MIGVITDTLLHIESAKFFTVTSIPTLSHGNEWIILLLPETTIKIFLVKNCLKRVVILINYNIFHCRKIFFAKLNKIFVKTHKIKSIRKSMCISMCPKTTISLFYTFESVNGLTPAIIIMYLDMRHRLGLQLVTKHHIFSNYLSKYLSGMINKKYNT